jgi:hypothetical protein
VPELWLQTSITSYSFCYAECYKAANWADIPSGWK